MADLEELGFIEKTHSSSGRIPSEKGYRYYVDHLLSPRKLSSKELVLIQSVFQEKIFELEKQFKNRRKFYQISQTTHRLSLVQS